MKIGIPEMNMEALEKKLARISKKAAKYGCDCRYKVVGTVKEHKDYRGVKQTELTRCKVERIGDLRGADLEEAYIA